MATTSSFANNPEIFAGEGVDVAEHLVSVTPLEVFRTQGTTSPMVLVTVVTPTPARRTKRIRKPSTKCRKEPAPRTIKRFGTEAK